MRNITLLMIIGLLSIFAGCKKDIFDYRTKYTGSWEFTVNWTEANIDSVGQLESGEYSHLGEITTGEADDELVVRYSDTNSAIIAIDKNGDITNFPTQYASGDFDGTENINLYLRYGGLGGFVAYEIKGKKD